MHISCHKRSDLQAEMNLIYLPKTKCSTEQNSANKEKNKKTKVDLWKEQEEVLEAPFI